MNHLEDIDKTLENWVQDIVYEYGRGKKHSKHYREETYGSSFDTETFCKEKAHTLNQAINTLILRGKIEELKSLIKVHPDGRWKVIQKRLAELESQIEGEDGKEM